MNKKGMTAGALTAILITLVVVVIVLSLYQTISTRYVQVQQAAECKQSVAAYASLAELTKDEITVPITCPLREITVDSSNAYDIQKAVAEEMKTCWDMWGEGKYRLFEEEGIYCHICSIVDFKNEELSIVGFPQFLNNEPIPKSTQTYAQYIGGFSVGDVTDLLSDQDRVAMKQSLSQDVMAMDKEYAVVFIYARGDKFIADLLQGIRAETAFAGGLVALGGATAVGVGIFYASNPVGWIAAGVTAVGVGGYSAYAALFNKPDSAWMSMIVLRENTPEILSQLECTHLPAKQYREQEIR